MPCGSPIWASTAGPPSPLDPEPPFPASVVDPAVGADPANPVMKTVGDVEDTLRVDGHVVRMVERRARRGASVTDAVAGLPPPAAVEIRPSGVIRRTRSWPVPRRRSVPSGARAMPRGAVGARRRSPRRRRRALPDRRRLQSSLMSRRRHAADARVARVGDVRPCRHARPRRRSVRGVGACVAWSPSPMPSAGEPGRRRPSG